MTFRWGRCWLVVAVSIGVPAILIATVVVILAVSHLYVGWSVKRELTRQLDTLRPFAGFKVGATSVRYANFDEIDFGSNRNSFYLLRTLEPSEETAEKSPSYREIFRFYREQLDSDESWDGWLFCAEVSGWAGLGSDRRQGPTLIYEGDPTLAIVFEEASGQFIFTLYRWPNGPDDPCP